MSVPREAPQVEGVQIRVRRGPYKVGSMEVGQGGVDVEIEVKKGSVWQIEELTRRVKEIMDATGP